jgi:hypothetical protein
MPANPWLTASPILALAQPKKRRCHTFSRHAQLVDAVSDQHAVLLDGRDVLSPSEASSSDGPVPDGQQLLEASDQARFFQGHEPTGLDRVQSAVHLRSLTRF